MFGVSTVRYGGYRLYRFTVHEVSVENGGLTVHSQTYF